MNFREKPYTEIIPLIHETQGYKDNKNFFIELCQSLKNPNVDQLLVEFDIEKENLPNFWDAPAAASEHGNFPGGLVMHSINVYNQFNQILDQDTNKQIFGHKISKETRIIASLFHDICKWQLYQPCLLKKAVKQKTDNPDDKTAIMYPIGAFMAKPYETVETSSLGHSVKSLFILQKYGIKLTEQQAALIRWHMTQFDREFITCQKIIDKLNPECILFGCADWIASMSEPKVGEDE